MNTHITAAQLARKLGVDISKINTVTAKGEIVPYFKGEVIEVEQVPFILAENKLLDYKQTNQLGALLLDCFKKSEPLEVAQKRQSLEIKLRRLEAQTEAAENTELRLKSRLDEFDAKLWKFTNNQDKSSAEYLELSGARREVEKQHNEAFSVLIDLQNKVKDLKNGIKELGEAPGLLDGFLDFIAQK